MPLITLAQFRALPKATAESESVELQCVQLDSIEALESVFKSAGKKDRVIVGFYAPWAIDVQQCAANEWLEFHRRLIALRQKYAKKLDLLNIAQHDAQALKDQAEIQIQAQSAEQGAAIISLLEVLYANYLPQYTRTYESLQLMAIAVPETPQGIRSEFETEEETLAVIAEIARLPKTLKAQQEEVQKVQSDIQIIQAEKQKLKTDLQKFQADHQKSQADYQKLQADHKKLQSEKQSLDSKSKTWESEKQDLQSENDLLLAQLHQVQEELERYYLKNKDLEGAITEAAQMVRQVRLEVVKNKPASRASGKRAAAWGQ